MNRLLRLMPSVYFLSYLPLGMIFPYLVVDLESNNVDHIGLLLTMPSLLMMISGPLWGVIADWFQRTVLVLQGAACLAVIGLSIMSIIPEYTMLGMGIYSLGWAPVASLTDALTMESLRQEGERLQINAEDRYGRIRMWGSVGYMVGVLLIGWLVTISPGWGLIGGGVSSALFLLVLFFVPNLHVTVSRPTKDDVVALLKHRELLWIFLCSGLHFSVHLASSNFIVKHVQSLGLSEMVASVAIAIGVVVEVAVMFYGGSRLKAYQPHHLFQFACGLGIVRWLFMAVGTTELPIVIGQALHGITFGLFWLSAVRLVKGWTPPELSSTGQSLLGTSVGGVGAVFGVYGASVIVEMADTITFYWASVGIAVLATILSLRIQCRTS